MQNLTWNVTSFWGNMLLLKVKFSHPIYIGTRENDPDYITVTVLDASIFRDKTGTRELSNETYFMTHLLKKQLLNDFPSELLSQTKPKI